MEPIPDDILAAAAAVVERGYDEGLIDAVCRALMAERERCARLAAEQQTVWDDGIDEVGSVASGIRAQHGASIAAAIRRGTP